MLILNIIESLRRGGKERQLTELLAGLAGRSGIASELAVIGNDIHYDRINSLGIPVYIMPRRSKYDFGMLSRVNRLFRDRKPDIVHSWGAMCSVYSAASAKLNGAAFINGMVRDSKEVTWRDSEYRWLKLTEPFSDVVLSNSHAGLRSYRVPAAKGVCIHNGFDFGRIAGLRPASAIREELAITTPHVVGMVASFFPWKDHDTFFAAALNVLQTRSDVTFVAVGDGPNLERYRNDPHLARNDRIKMIGLRQDVEDVIAVFDIGVLLTKPGIRGEGISNALTEVMALGKPVVASNGGGTPELVNDGQTGVLVEPQNVEAVVAAIEGLLNDPARATKMGVCARRRIQGDFNLEKMVDSYLGLYHLLTGDGGGVRKSRAGTMLQSSPAATVKPVG